MAYANSADAIRGLTLFPILLSISTFTNFWANSADDKLMMFFLFFPDNRIWHCQNLFSGEKKIGKIFQHVICWKFFVRVLSVEKQLHKKQNLGQKKYLQNFRIFNILLIFSLFLHEKKTGYGTFLDTRHCNSNGSSLFMYMEKIREILISIHLSSKLQIVHTNKRNVC